ncbi:MAG TPA: hypothetical protein VMU76_01645 [Acidimicrobiales bacterium]|nr:hypothetical protein [Acidimicrobiales bacterium]
MHLDKPAVRSSDPLALPLPLPLPLAAADRGTVSDVGPVPGGVAQ